MTERPIHRKASNDYRWDGVDIMLLIGGGLLEARERLTEATAEFVAAVRGHPG